MRSEARGTSKLSEEVERRTVLSFSARGLSRLYATAEAKWSKKKGARRGGRPLELS
jgi:hypothetical protein